MYSRILLKLSGEALAAPNGDTVIDTNFARGMAEEIKKVVESGVQVAIVIGGGNIFRGALGESLGMDRVRGDYMGMLATVINALGVAAALKMVGQPAEVQSPIATSSVVHPYSQLIAREALGRGKVVIVAGGTGNPYFTTDTAAALRAVELNCKALLKGTKVDGVYSDDPIENPQAERFDKLSFEEVMVKNLKVMDQTAFSMCRDNDVPIIVFDLFDKGNLMKAVSEEAVGTLVS